MIDECTSREDMKLDAEIVTHLSCRYMLGGLHFIEVANAMHTPHRIAVAIIELYLSGIIMGGNKCIRISTSTASKFGSQPR